MIVDLQVIQMVLCKNPMRRLLLFRHAKANLGTRGMRDFDRALAPRGLEAATRMGHHLAQSGLVPDLILASSAARTRETVQLALDAMGVNIETRYFDTLYTDGPEEVLKRLADVDASYETVMVVGHNPTIAECAIALAAPGGTGLRTAIARKFPTGGLAVLEFPVDAWPSIEAGTAELKAFVKPKALAEQRPD